MSDLSLSQVLTIPGTQPVALDNTLQKQSQGSLATQVTLEALLIPKPSSTIIFPVRDCYANHLGINQGDMLIVDRDAAGDVVVAGQPDGRALAGRLGVHAGPPALAWS